jgi:hypothetical protein
MAVIAYKNGKKQEFSDMAWRLLGTTKNGWVEVASQSIENTVKRPDMGPALTPKEAKIENTLNVGETEEEAIERLMKESGKSNKGKEAEFMKAIEGLSKTKIKDFLDQQTPPVKYSNAAKEDSLKKILAETLNYDIVKLQKASL